MINLSQLYEDIAPIMPFLSSVPFIIKEQEGRKPADDYITVKFKNWQRLGSQSMEHAGGTSSVFNTKSLYRVTIEFVAIGNDANENLLSVEHNIEKPSVRSQFQAEGFAFLNCDPIRPIPKLVSTGWEQQYTLNANFNIVVSDSDDLGYIEFVEINTTIKDQSNNTVVDSDITVDIVP
jgi:hypothetical protein